MRKRLANLLGAISPGCRDSVRLLSLPALQPLSFGRRLGLRLHLVLCAFCRRYRRQLEFLRTSLDSEPPAPESGLPPGARRRIRDHLAQAAPGPVCPDRGSRRRGRG